jgi:hypothetical protein
MEFIKSFMAGVLKVRRILLTLGTVSPLTSRVLVIGRHVDE